MYWCQFRSSSEKIAIHDIGLWFENGEKKAIFRCFEDDVIGAIDIVFR